LARSTSWLPAYEGGGEGKPVEWASVPHPDPYPLPTPTLSPVKNGEREQAEYATPLIIPHRNALLENSAVKKGIFT
jgi:hypothetical protein